MAAEKSYTSCEEWGCTTLRDVITRGRLHTVETDTAAVPAEGETLLVGHMLRGTDRTRNK